eukprot:CAMPEP_0182537978 /NCGR_PEP_ID=MMETSP1323-20130603/22936_1 /TAXON_ID=236787 /ORGANISM="Florenciella parvula, Strain RCC1693" /LENGTH=57 /DNA_ID=CAMNT_0024748417 /DNA_START=92 /DNA_END=262 /DNA_ORIENTATION=-
MPDVPAPRRPSRDVSVGVKYPGQPTQQRSYRAAAGPASQTVTAARAKPKPKAKPAAP